MKVTKTNLPGVILIEPTVFEDSRGFFKEIFNEKRYQLEAGITASFVQDNLSQSSCGVLRGLHFQVQRPQGKLAQVLEGEVFDVAVDINPASPTFKDWYGTILSQKNHKQLYVPPGYAHGFLVLSETANFYYKCTDYYVPDDQAGVLWNDPELAIDWPMDTPPLVSDRDGTLPTISTYLNQ